VRLFFFFARLCHAFAPPLSFHWRRRYYHYAQAPAAFDDTVRHKRQAPRYCDRRLRCLKKRQVRCRFSAERALAIRYSLFFAELFLPFAFLTIAKRHARCHKMRYLTATLSMYSDVLCLSPVLCHSVASVIVFPAFFFIDAENTSSVASHCYAMVSPTGRSDPNCPYE